MRRGERGGRGLWERVGWMWIDLLHTIGAINEHRIALSSRVQTCVVSISVNIFVMTVQYCTASSLKRAMFRSAPIALSSQIIMLFQAPIDCQN